MNYMKQVAQMLGVEIGEEFKVDRNCYDRYWGVQKFKFNEIGLLGLVDGENCWELCDSVLRSLLNSNYLVVKLPKPILDDVEKEYLSNVIKPFRNKVAYITKGLNLNEFNNYSFEHISIGVYITNFTIYNINFPRFEKGTMYKGMELNKEYTLDDLGI